MSRCLPAEMYMLLKKKKLTKNTFTSEHSSLYGSYIQSNFCWKGMKKKGIMVVGREWSEHFTHVCMWTIHEKGEKEEKNFQRHYYIFFFHQKSLSYDLFSPVSLPQTCSVSRFHAISVTLTQSNEIIIVNAIWRRPVRQAEEIFGIIRKREKKKTINSTFPSGSAYAWTIKEWNEKKAAVREEEEEKK